MDATDGLTGSASVQLPQYDESEPMEIGSLAPGLHQMGKVAPDDKVPGRCYRCQGRGHRARDCPTPVEVSLEERRTQPRRDRPAKCDRCHYAGHTAAECKADWDQVAGRRRVADKGAHSGKPSRVANMEGSTPPARQANQKECRSLGPSQPGSTCWEERLNPTGLAWASVSTTWGRSLCNPTTSPSQKF